MAALSVGRVSLRGELADPSPPQVLLQWRYGDTINLVITLTIKLPESLARRLEASARQRQTPKSGLVRQFIERGLGEENAAPTFHDLAQAHCGCVGSGIQDLATHPVHLEGYGQ